MDSEKTFGFNSPQWKITNFDKICDHESAEKKSNYINEEIVLAENKELSLNTVGSDTASEKCSEHKVNQEIYLCSSCKTNNVNSNSSNEGTCDICATKLKGTVATENDDADGIHQCTFCGIHFSKFSVLQKHLDRQHKNNKWYTCGYCNKGFSELHKLEIHVAIHMGEKPYKCQHCESAFIHPSSLNNHVKKHAKLKLQCTICGSKFRDSWDLRKHLRVHTGERPYKCHICGKGFIQSAHLQGHFRTHTGEQAYKCDYCHDSFGRQSSLETHLTKHIEEKIYYCKYCNAKYPTLDTIKGHINNTHIPNLKLLI